ncbi:MAG: hypothetical protein AB1896_09035 [Thermodesulfobacteriota bacterium]
MRKITLWLILALLGCLLVAACSGRVIMHGAVSKVPVCERAGSDWNQAGSNADDVYVKISPDTCLAYLAPTDQAAWWESRLDSRRLRGGETVLLGCTHCPAGIRDCKAPNNCGGCSYLTLYFDFSKFPEKAEITAAKLALFVPDRPDLAAQAILEGRVNVGGDFQVVAEKAQVVGNWVLFDLTPFACRAVVERRNSVSLDLSLPCGQDDQAKVATVKLSGGAEPTLIVEYR